MNTRTDAAQLLPEIDPGHLDALEEESLFILREVAAAFECPALLYSAGKDSCVGAAPPAVDAFQRAPPAGRALPRLPHQQLDRA